MATDDELYEIGRRAYGIRPADYKNKLEGLAAERRALYEEGWDKGYARGRGDSDRAADWLLTDEAAWPLVSLVVEGSDHTVSNRDALWDVKSALKTLHDRITGGGQ